MGAGNGKQLGTVIDGITAQKLLSSNQLGTDHKGGPTVQLTIRNETQQDLFMCWVNEHGVHYHFRKMKNSHVETTFSGHLFVFYVLNRSHEDIEATKNELPVFNDLILKDGEHVVVAYRPTSHTAQRIVIQKKTRRNHYVYNTKVLADVQLEWHDFLPCCPLPIVKTDQKIYQSYDIEGFSVQVESGLFLRYPKLHQEISKDISHIKNVIPPTAFQIIAAKTKIWLNSSLVYGPKRAPTKGRGMCVHPSKDWLVRNGCSAEKHGGIEIYSAGEYLEERGKYPLYLLHEMSHVWHLNLPDGGYDCPIIMQVYKNAMAAGLYNQVTLRGHDQGKTFKAYACENQMEYFAEISTAFFSKRVSATEGNKWSPYTSSELKSLDEEGYNMCQRVWSMPKDQYLQKD